MFRSAPLGTLRNAGRTASAKELQQREPAASDSVGIGGVLAWLLEVGGQNEYQQKCQRTRLRDSHGVNQQRAIPQGLWRAGWEAYAPKGQYYAILAVRAWFREQCYHFDNIAKMYR